MSAKLSSTLPSLLIFLSSGCITTAKAQNEYLAGYLIIPVEGRANPNYNQGYSMYVAAWPLQRTYPGHRFQTGLPGTWMFAQQDGPPPKDFYSDIEGGLGWWTDTRFPTETPKFIMGGVGANFSEIANGPSHGWGDWKDPRGLYGVAQLSPWLLFPIDGLDVKQGTSGEMFGYGYLNLPLLDPKLKPENQDVKTGSNCWTLFLNTANFKGPVAFFTPRFFAHSAIKEPRLAGHLLDVRPSDPNRAVQMETQYIPCRVAKDADGTMYARIAPTSFPLNASGNSLFLEQDTVYGKDALWTATESWFNGGTTSNGLINEAGAHIRTYGKGGYATWEIRVPDSNGKEVKVPIDWNSFSSPLVPSEDQYGNQWNKSLVSQTTMGHGPLATLPQYFRLELQSNGKKKIWRPISEKLVPKETNLQTIQWTRPSEPRSEPYTTPEVPGSSWTKPGPVAGPYKAWLGDGSVVTYYWYRFADQPAILNAGLTDAEREELQRRVEKIHRTWKKDQNYLAPPHAGKLADLDPAQIVKPPKGYEIGYVPIATRQEFKG